MRIVHILVSLLFGVLLLCNELNHVYQITRVTLILQRVPQYSWYQEHDCIMCTCKAHVGKIVEIDCKLYLREVCKIRQ